MKNLVLLFLIFLSGLCPFCKSSKSNIAGTFNNKIDTSIFYYLDVDYDSVLDEFSLNFKSSSINSPFIWSFEIKSGNNTLFLMNRNDEVLNKFFSDTLYVRDCSDYTDCKRKFYFEILPKMIFERKIVSKKVDYSGFVTAIKPFLTDSLKLSLELQTKVLNEFEDRIEMGSIIIIPIVLSPAIVDHPVTYSTTLKRMIKIPWD